MWKRAKHLTAPPPRTAECRALRSRRVVKSSDLKDEELQHGRLDEDLKNPAQLEAVGVEQRFVAEDDVQDVPEGDAKVRALFVLRRRHVADGVDEQVERKIVELGEGVRGTSMASRVMAVIVSKG